MAINLFFQREISNLKPETIAQMRRDYQQGLGLTLWDISLKYRVTFATACHIIKNGN